MLNEEDLKKAIYLAAIVEVAKLNNERPTLGAYDMEWLTKTLLALNDKYTEFVKKFDTELHSLHQQEVIQLAKRRLMDTFKLSEKEAYKYIRKTAMDESTSRYVIACRILSLESLS